MSEVIVKTIAPFHKSDRSIIGNIAIYRRECAGRVYSVKGIMIGAQVIHGVCRWQVIPVYEWDNCDNQWVFSAFNRVHNVADEDVLNNWYGALELK